MKLKPINDRVVVQPAAADEKTSGGIIIPDTAKEKPQRGEVLAVGNGKLLDNGEVRAIDINIGDTVLFGKYGGTEVPEIGEGVLVLREDDIMAVVES